MFECPWMELKEQKNQHRIDLFGWHLFPRHSSTEKEHEWKGSGNTAASPISHLFSRSLYTGYWHTEVQVTKGEKQAVYVLTITCKHIETQNVQTKKSARLGKELATIPICPTYILWTIAHSWSQMQSQYNELCHCWHCSDCEFPFLWAIAYSYQGKLTSQFKNSINVISEHCEDDFMQGFKGL